MTRCSPHVRVRQLVQLFPAEQDVGDADGLKHPWMSACTLEVGGSVEFFLIRANPWMRMYARPRSQRVRMFKPTAVVYLLPTDPAAAVFSHFRRGWAAPQLCRVTSGAEMLLQPGGGLHDIFVGDYNKYTAFDAFVRWVRKYREDPFRIWQHADSWRKASANIGAPVWFTTIDGAARGLVTLSVLAGLHNTSLLGGLQQLEIKQRPSMYSTNVAQWLPMDFVGFYANISSRLQADFSGRCFISASKVLSSKLNGIVDPCTSAGLFATAIEAQSDMSLLAAAPAAVVVAPTAVDTNTTLDPAAQAFYAHTQIRIGSTCFKLMAPRATSMSASGGMQQPVEAGTTAAAAVTQKSPGAAFGRAATTSTPGADRGSVSLRRGHPLAL
jgi:hypothetical protein